MSADPGRDWTRNMDALRLAERAALTLRDQLADLATRAPSEAVELMRTQAEHARATCAEMRKNLKQWEGAT